MGRRRLTMRHLLTEEEKKFFFRDGLLAMDLFTCLCKVSGSAFEGHVGEVTKWVSWWRSALPAGTTSLRISNG